MCIWVFGFWLWVYVCISYACVFSSLVPADTHGELELLVDAKVAVGRVSASAAQQVSGAVSTTPNHRGPNTSHAFSVLAQDKRYENKQTQPPLTVSLTSSPSPNGFGHRPESRSRFSSVEKVLTTDIVCGPTPQAFGLGYICVCVW